MKRPTVVDWSFQLVFPGLSFNKMSMCGPLAQTIVTVVSKCHISPQLSLHIKTSPGASHIKNFELVR
jgi:hypothetical protein